MKVAILTGASGGIGKETVKVFIKNGFFVCGQYNKGEKQIEELKKELASENLLDGFFAFQCDLNNPKSVQNAIQNLSKSFKHIDVLVNNAGCDLYKLITDTTEDEWQEIFDVNVKSAFVFSKFCLQSMIEQKSGKIVNVSSIWGIDGACMETAYSASKSALIGLTKSLAKEVAPSGINVNCVCPGVINTKMNARFSNEEMQEIIDSTPLGRLGDPKEIAELIYFLCSEKASFITGQVITADGGYIL